MVEAEFTRREALSAELAKIIVTGKDVPSIELDHLTGQTLIVKQANHTGNLNLAGNCANPVVFGTSKMLGAIFGNFKPRFEIVRGELPILLSYNFCHLFGKECECSPDTNNMHRHEHPVQDKDTVIERTGYRRHRGSPFDPVSKTVIRGASGASVDRDGCWTATGFQQPDCQDSQGCPDRSYSVSYPQRSLVRKHRENYSHMKVWQMSSSRHSRVTDTSDSYFATQLTPRQVEERVAAHLIDRQFLEAEDLKIALGQKGEPAGAEPFLARCASNRLVTTGQSRRIREELQELMRSIVPGYVLEKKIGRGSTSVVYLATQTCLNRHVALKILDGNASAQDGACRAFLESTSRAAGLSHPALVSVYHAGIAAGRPFCAMDLVLVPTLDQILESQGPLETAVLKRVATQALELLTYLESKGVVHRDIKPGNLFLDAMGNLRVGDLGLALWSTDSREQRTQERGLAMGTPHYMSPEQILGEKIIDSRADLYSLGATLFHLATGRTPFAGSAPSEVQDRHLSSPAPDIRQLRPDIPQDLVDLVKRLMAKDPTRRGKCIENLERWRTAATRPLVPLPAPAPPAPSEPVLVATVVEPASGMSVWLPWLACWAMGALLLASLVAHALRK
jgi:serine/threonine-protein kinase